MAIGYHTIGVKYAGNRYREEAAREGDNAGPVTAMRKSAEGNRSSDLYSIMILSEELLWLGHRAQTHGIELQTCRNVTIAKYGRPSRAAQPIAAPSTAVRVAARAEADCPRRNSPRTARDYTIVRSTPYLMRKTQTTEK